MNTTTIMALYTSSEQLLAHGNCTRCNITHIHVSPPEESLLVLNGGGEDDDGSGSYKDRIEYKIAIGLVTYLWPVIVACGTLGNLLSFCVLMRQAMADTSVYFYLAMLALADIGVLLLSAFKTWIRVVSGGFELLHVSGISCKLIMYVFLICLHMSAWFVIAVTVDRFIVIWLPLRSHRVRSSNCFGNFFCSENHQSKVVTIIMFLILLIYNGHLMWTIDLIEENGQQRCTYSETNYFTNNIYPVMKLLSYCIIPFFIVLLLNVAIIIRISKTKPMLNINRSASVKSSSHQSRITGMLLTVSIAWLLLTGPFTIWSLIPSADNTHTTKAQAMLVKTICFTLMYLNHSVNFCLYCCTGARFRRQLRDMFSLKKRRRNSYKSTRSTGRTSLKVIRFNSHRTSEDYQADNKIELCNDRI